MDLLDRSIIEEVRDALGDEAYHGFAQRMLREMQDVQPVMQAHLDAGAHETLAQVAHRSAGSAASVGAAGLSAVLRQIENVARSDQRQGLADLVGGLPQRLQETEAGIDALLKGA